MTKPKLSVNIFLIISAVLSIVSGYCVIQLSDIPFGSQFRLCFYLFIFVAVLFFILSAFKWWKMKRRDARVVSSFFLLISIILLTATIIFVVDYRIFLYQGFPPRPESEQWQDDLIYLTNKMKTIHPGLFSLIPEDSFNSAVSALSVKIPGMNDNLIKAELYKILALPGDAHTLPNIQCLTLDWHIYPIQTYFFEDGVYVINAGREYERLIGSRILNIGGVDVLTVHRRLKKYISTENEYGSYERSAILIAEFLEAEGIIENVKAAQLTFLTPENNRITVEMSPVHYLPYFYWAMIRPVEKELSPFILNDRKNNYWFEYWDKTKTIYFQFNAVVNQEGGETLPKFTDRLKAFADSTAFDRLIIDLRLNGGGNGNLIVNLVDMIKNNPRINRDGKLFILIGRKTFSAAVMFSAMLQNNTQAVFVGEPTGQGPIFYSSPAVVILPNSKIQAYISTRFTQASLLMDDRKMIKPDIGVTYTSRDFIEKTDPAMEAVFNYKHVFEKKQDHAQLTNQKLIGRYLFSSNEILQVWEENGKLRFRITDFIPTSYIRVESDMFARTPTEFRTDIDHVGLSFNLENNGSVKSLVFRYGEQKKEIFPISREVKLPMEYLTEGNLDSAIKGFMDNKRYGIAVKESLENSFNTLGYQFLREKNYLNAIKVFKLNVFLFPESSNTYDSLAEGYMLNGDKYLAIVNYKKSLELNPVNRNAVQMLMRLESE